MKALKEVGILALGIAIGMAIILGVSLTNRVTNIEKNFNARLTNLEIFRNELVQILNRPTQAQVQPAQPTE